MARSLRLATFVAVLAAPGLAGDSAGGYFENGRWGYKVRVPSGWTQAALSADEEWIASKHLGKRELEPKKMEYWVREAPEMWVIGFPHARKDERTAKRTETLGGTELLVENPYQDYKDFIKRNKNFLVMTGAEEAGYYFSKEEEAEIDGVKVTQYEIKVEKMVNAPRRVVAWVYHFEDVDLAVQFKILEDHYDGYERGFRACLRSLKRVARTDALPGAATTGKAIVDEEDVEKLPAEERRRVLEDRVKQKYRREIDALPDGWGHEETEHYLALYGCEKEFVLRTLRHCETVRDHLEEMFGGVGDRFVPKTIVRFFSSDAEREAYSRTTRDIFDVVQEVLVVQGSGWEKQWEYGWVNRQIFATWLNHRNKNLASNMPDWLGTGLGKYMEMLRTKGSRIDFANEDWGRDLMRLQVKQGQYVPARELVTSHVWTLEAPAEGGVDPFQRNQQAESLVYWLMTKGNRGKYKGLVKDYMGALVAVVEEAEAKFLAEQERLEQEARKAAAAPTDVYSEEEDENAFDPSKYQEQLIDAFKKKRTEILEETFRRVFGSWSDRDWENFTKAWVSHAG